jgi:hypothetical protein
VAEITGIRTGEVKSTIEAKLSKAPDDSTSVKALRWVPDTTIPLSRFISKYGAPDERGYDEKMAPYCQWSKLGIVVGLFGDESTVIRVDYTFTPEEMQAALTRAIARMTGGK